jgi:hypothetical protein
MVSLAGKWHQGSAKTWPSDGRQGQVTGIEPLGLGIHCDDVASFARSRQIATIADLPQAANCYALFSTGVRYW